MKRKTTAERAYIAGVIRSIDILSCDLTARRWKEEAGRLLEVIDQDTHIEDTVSTVLFYGYVRGLEISMKDHEIFPFTNEELYEQMRNAWRAVLEEYLAEMRKGKEMRDVDN